MLEHGRRFGRRQIDRLGHQQPLRLERAGEHLVAELLVQNPLVQRVLVDHFDADVGFDDQVAIVNLQRVRASRGRRRRAASLGVVAAIADVRRVPPIERLERRHVEPVQPQRLAEAVGEPIAPSLAASRLARLLLAELLLRPMDELAHAAVAASSLRRHSPRPARSRSTCRGP